MDLFVEWKPDATRDGYRETFVGKDTLDYPSKRALKLRGQMFTFAGRLMDSQPRLFTFAIDIYGDRARLYRFDPSCVVVSEPILLHEDARLLDEFFLRYTAASPLQRGYDPTMIPATESEKTLFRARVQEYLDRAEKRSLRAHPQAKTLINEVFRVQVNDLEGNPHWYLSCKPGQLSSDRSPCGRFTRGFIATPAISNDCTPPNGGHQETLHNDRANLFWLKDSWRPTCTESEISIYHKLKAKGVPNLPDIVCAGDILDEGVHQGTLNDSLLSDCNDSFWARPTKTIRHMVHHRIVSGLLIPLTSVRNARELLLVGRDILTSESVPQHDACQSNHSLSDRGRVP